MADLSINSQISNSLNSSVNTRGVESRKTADAKDVNTQNRNPDERLQDVNKDAAAKAEEVKASEYGPIIAQSGDGDTVRVKNENSELKAEEKDSAATIYDAAKGANEKKEKEDVPNIDLPEKKPEPEEVKPKETEVRKEEQQRSKYDLTEEGEKEKLARKTAENARKETVEERNPELANRQNQEKISKAGSSTYAGYTDAQLEQMYLRGDVSQIEYNKEIEARDAAREARIAEATENSRRMVENEAESREAERTAEIVNTVQNGNVAEGPGTVPLEARLQAIQNIDNMTNG
ncbi:MAG: hypothetical protein J5802_06145 [Butyrivibrio sp.]|nr:hypothetical protein [Butyrivibrio sp.]